MRTLITIITIILLLLVGSITSNRFIQTTTQKIGDQLNIVEQSLSNRKWESAKNELTTAQKSWEMSNLWWSILFDHQEIDTINLSLTQLENYIKAKDFSDSLVELSTIKLRLENLKESTKLTVKNIF
ncbi:hypothetical protein UF75_4852 [Desulfosporosinus sp. I2]|uniref:DUF4363 family protein n=1 Tax=Desulfosporosinus sp. I2 TaxID=1617025 RepID=UPI0005EF0F0A|nr:DUF4363 family protein [Desulfosporosinus sp. I2]KJR44764.1 hypothetical protein UF75_4852 [Desulfosporosinus sp. I2]